MALTGAIDGPPSRFARRRDRRSGHRPVRRPGDLGRARPRAHRARAAPRHHHAGVDGRAPHLPSRCIYFATGSSSPRMGDAHPSICCPYESLRTQDGLYMLAVGNDAQFQRLMKLLGLEGLAQDPRFVTNRARVTNRPALLEHIRPKFEAKTSSDWDRILSGKGHPGRAGARRPAGDRTSQLRARGAVKTTVHPAAEQIRAVRSGAARGKEAPFPAPPPLLGEHTRSVLGEVLGLDADALATLIRAERDPPAMSALRPRALSSDWYPREAAACAGSPRRACARLGGARSLRGHRPARVGATPCRCLARS
ncbi:MAG: CoA transferase [Myxococcota bacterium]